MSNDFSSRRIQLETADTVKMELLGLASSAAGWGGRTHSHEYWEMLLIMKDKPDPYQMVLDGVAYPNDQALGLYLVPPNVVHCFMNTGKLPHRNLYVGFSYKSESEEERLKDAPVILPVDTAEIIQVVADLREIVRKLSLNPLQSLNDRRLAIMNCVFRLVRYLTNPEHGQDTPGELRNRQLAGEMMQYIADNLDQHIHIDEMAAAFYTSPNYLGQIFRQATGMTIKTYHNKRRMEYALHLLKSGQHNISAVAAAVGFSDVTYFSRKFKDYYGLSPSQLLAIGEDERPQGQITKQD